MVAPRFGTILGGTLADVKGVAVVLHDKSLVTDELVRELFSTRLKANDGATQRSLATNPNIASEGVAGRLSVIDIPTLVAWGADDGIVPLEQGRACAAGIRGATKIIPDCEHAPSLEKPEAFLDAVSSFRQQ
jgi:pimeloyl-ACP methyl ester carboxylesterase